MADIKKIIRPNILKLKPYTSARDEFSGEAQIALDANENAYGSATSDNHNRYPDPKHIELRRKLSVEKKIPVDNIFAGNGSDEAIDLIMRIFCRPGTDRILTFHPSYPIYQVLADINDLQVTSVDLNADYTMDDKKIIAALDEKNLKVVFLCNPNNPTGNAFKPEIIKPIIKACADKNIITVMDEAYIDFCPSFSMLGELKNFENLIVLQTLSKAWGMAEIRLGMAFASAEIIDFLYKVKPPYNVNGVSQQMASAALAHAGRKNEMLENLLRERERLCSRIEEIKIVEKVYPSEANFIFVKVKNAAAVFERLLKKGVVVRDRSKVRMCDGCLRITVGTEEDNNFLLAALADDSTFYSDYKSTVNAEMFVNLAAREAEIVRTTNETDIRIKLNLDGSGKTEINTGLGFFDHMLSQIAGHSGVDLAISCKGDVHIDEHHSIEDTAIALGEAFKEALGDKRGIERYGFVLPMDDALAHVALDFSGRSWVVWDTKFKRERIGEMPTEMFFHFFKSFSDAAKCNLNIQAEGENEHHKIEAIFKAFARALKQAIRRDLRSSYIPSTKGTL